MMSVRLSPLKSPVITSDQSIEVLQRPKFSIEKSVPEDRQTFHWPVASTRLAMSVNSSTSTMLIVTVVVDVARGLPLSRIWIVRTNCSVVSKSRASVLLTKTLKPPPEAGAMRNASSVLPPTRV